MLISTALLLDSIIRNSVCTPAKLPCRRVEVGYGKYNKITYTKRNLIELRIDFIQNIYFISYFLLSTMQK
jgi:hypothetical protein